MPLEVQVQTNIQTREQAQAAMSDFLRNPPVNPQRAIEWLSKNFTVGGSVSSALAFAAPAIGTFMPMLSGIFEMFSSGPSIGEVTLSAIGQLGAQIQNLAIELTNTIQRTAELERQKTVDFVLSGVDEISRQESAALQMIDMVKLEQVQLEAIKKNEIYTDYVSQSMQMRQEVLENIQSRINSVRQQINQQYDTISSSLAMLGIDLTKLSLDMLKCQEQKQQLTATSRSAPGAPETQQKSAVPIAIFATVGLGLLLLFTDKKNH